MNATTTLAHLQPVKRIKGKKLLAWRFLQLAVLSAGVAIVFALVFFPEIGIHALWNVLIPIAPALFVLSTGLWRNICPLGTFSLLPNHAGFSKGKRLPLKWQGRLQLAGVILLFLIVPARHLIFDKNGPATAILLIAIAIAAFTAGYFFDWKSGWCSSLCPVHPVEKMYGQKVLFTPPNAHCTQCHNCVIPCPDSKPGMNPLAAKLRTSHRIASHLIIGGLPGFIWGWFHVPDYSGATGWPEIATAYGLPLLGLASTLTVFLTLRYLLRERYEDLQVSVFATAAITCYYWYRIPALVGYGLFPGDGMLVNLTGHIPAGSIFWMQAAVTLFFTWWLIFRKKKPAVWAIRPPFAVR